MFFDVRTCRPRRCGQTEGLAHNHTNWYIYVFFVFLRFILLIDCSFFTYTHMLSCWPLCDFRWFKTGSICFPIGSPLVCKPAWWNWRSQGHIPPGIETFGYTELWEPSGLLKPAVFFSMFDPGYPFNTSMRWVPGNSESWSHISPTRPWEITIAKRLHMYQYYCARRWLKFQR